MMRHVLFFGYGYCARELARSLRSEGWDLSGTCRGNEKRQAMESDGLRSWIFDRDHPLPAAALAGVTHVVASIPPDAQGDLVAQVHGDDLANLDGLIWAALLSTTGVYGDRGGAWVTEDSTLQPSNERSRQRVSAENEWMDLRSRHRVPTHIFRIAGIYGPGRNPLDLVRSGRASRIVKSGLTLGRIHVADIAGALRASMTAPRPGNIYNLTDDEPVAPQDITTYACKLLGVAPPPEVSYDTADMPTIMREFYSDNKRVSNERIKNELGYELQYPNYRTGLEALHKM